MERISCAHTNSLDMNMQMGPKVTSFKRIEATDLAGGVLPEFLFAHWPLHKHRVSCLAGLAGI